MKVTKKDNEAQLAIIDHLIEKGLLPLNREVALDQYIRSGRAALFRAMIENNMEQVAKLASEIGKRETRPRDPSRIKIALLFAALLGGDACATTPQAVVEQPQNFVRTSSRSRDKLAGLEGFDPIVEELEEDLGSGSSIRACYKQSYDGKHKSGR